MQNIRSGYNIALKEDGTVAVWDNNYYNQCIIPEGLTNVKAIAAESAAVAANFPITLWAGDVSQDNVINFIDIMKIAENFNTDSTDENFNPDSDLNKDNSINLVDIMIVAKHFNKKVDNYPDSVYSSYRGSYKGLPYRLPQAGQTNGTQPASEVLQI